MGIIAKICQELALHHHYSSRKKNLDFYLVGKFHYLLKQRNSTNPMIGGMSSAQKPPVNWWNSERQKPRNVIANDNMPPVFDGWFLTYFLSYAHNYLH